MIILILAPVNEKVNCYKLETLTIAENANVIPAILSYDLQDSTNPMTITYTDFFIFGEK